MNYYFKTFQNRSSIDWNELVGISNYEISFRELYSLCKLYIDHLDAETIPRQKPVKFYKRKNEKCVDWERELPLYINRLHLENIASLFFTRPSLAGLESLTIVRCNVSTFPWRSIPVTLRTLNLSKNMLGGHVSLSHTKNLRFINLSENSIESLDLPYDCNTADISYNKCQHIDFYNPLMFADFSWNCLSDFKGSKWLEKCNVSHNKLVKCDFSQCPKLLEVNVSFNSLCDTVTFSACKLLKKLSAAGNQLQAVEGIELLGDLELLDVSENALETFIVPIIRKVNLQNNPLQFFEWLAEPSGASSGGGGAFSFADFVNGEPGSNPNPIVNMASSFLREKLRMNRVDEMYGEGPARRHADTRSEKVYINLSNTSIQEFPETTIVQKSNRLNREMHILYYDNEYINIPYHPKCHVHVGRMQMYNWKRVKQGGRLMETILTQLENQEFYIVDSE
jgi:hypothetical protein